MNKDQALRLALEALGEINKLSIGENAICLPAEIDTAMDAIKQALAQPEGEPVAWMDEFGNIFPLGAQRGPKYLNEPMKPLYTSPPKREPLTDERVSLVREMRDVQGYDGNWNYDPYMQGLYNGLEFAVSLLEKREPVFRDAPKQWLGDISKKLDNFNIVGSKIASHGIKENT